MHRAVEIACGELARGAEQHRGMTVGRSHVHAGVAAGMREARLFDDRQRIMSARRPTQRAPATVTQRADHAGARNAFVHLQSEQAQGGSHDAGGARSSKASSGCACRSRRSAGEFREQIFDGSHTVSQRPSVDGVGQFSQRAEVVTRHRVFRFNRASGVLQPVAVLDPAVAIPSFFAMPMSWYWLCATCRLSGCLQPHAPS